MKDNLILINQFVHILPHEIAIIIDLILCIIIIKTTSIFVTTSGVIIIKTMSSSKLSSCFLSLTIYSMPAKDLGSP